ncbi:glycosyltransferase family protein [Pelagibius marinus]|uniref:glycosyltransferase family protein n=1 Tax=Pelagibius marinus TaxID=2762760 RepID=UPI0018726AB3|nr:glycosyltransferase [Pelagibius marinus]
MTERAPERVDVLLYVQHLLGIGHVRRAAVLARAFRRAGLKVVFVTGGLPVGGLGLEDVEVVQLPPARAQDESFAVILDEHGRPIDEAWKARRRALLLEVYRRCRPRVVMTELYPFGRRKMRFELDPLIEAARADSPPALIACSLRDVVVRPESAEKAAWMIDRFTRQFDIVYMHGDPRFFRLEDSFPECDALARRLHYTGYVTEAGRAVAAARRADDTTGRGEVVVSTGGGAVGAALLRTALAARALSPLAAAPWRLLIGPNLPEAEFRAIAETAPEGVTVERARPDFVALLSRARLSISQGGYNTLMEVLASGVPAVIVPFAGGTETEQLQRARMLAENDLITVVAEDGLSPESLAAGIAKALPQGGAHGKTPFRLDGAEETARHLVSRMKEAA